MSVWESSFAIGCLDCGRSYFRNSGGFSLRRCRDLRFGIFVRCARGKVPRERRRLLRRQNDSRFHRIESIFSLAAAKIFINSLTVFSEYRSWRACGCCWHVLAGQAMVWVRLRLNVSLLTGCFHVTCTTCRVPSCHDIREVLYKINVEPRLMNTVSECSIWTIGMRRGGSCASTTSAMRKKAIKIALFPDLPSLANTFSVFIYLQGNSTDNQVARALHVSHGRPALPISPRLQITFCISSPCKMRGFVDIADVVMSLFPIPQNSKTC